MSKLPWTGRTTTMGTLVINFELGASRLPSPSEMGRRLALLHF